MPDPSHPADPAEPRWPDDPPDLLALLPVVYVAWSDGLLSAAELDAIRQQVDALPWPDPAVCAQLLSWLDPAHPPGPAALEELRERVRKLPAGSAADRSLAELGLELARHAGADVSDGPWSASGARAALDAIEASLGVVGQEAVRGLVGAAAPGLGAPAALPFDGAAMAAWLRLPHRKVRERVLALLAEPALQMPLEPSREEYRARVLAAVERLTEEEIGALAFPAEYGGAGEPGQAIAAFETLAFGDQSVLIKFGVHFGLFGGSVLQLGTARHHRAYLADTARLELPGCFAMTERGHGSNVRDIETLATHDPERDELVIHTPHDGAVKHWIGNAALHGRMATVFCQLRVGGEEHGVHAVLVPIRGADGAPLPGVTIEDCGAKAGLNGVDNGQLRFHGVRVPRANLLDRFGRITDGGRYESPIPSAGRRFFTMLGTLVAGRISIAAASVSASKTGLTIAVRYSAARRQFGPEGAGEVPILDYLTQQRLLLPRLGAAYALHFASRELIERYTEQMADPEAPTDESVQRRIEVDAAGLKALASRHAIETLQACREAMGGQGYLAANRLGRLKADTDIYATFEGANVVLLQLVARGLLSKFGDAMGDLKLWGMVRYLAERAGTRVTELNPVVTRRTNSEHLRDPDFHLAAFEYREERLLGSVARRLKRMIDDGTDSFEAMNRAQDHLVALARAHVERQVLEAFHRGIGAAPTPELADVLRALATLWALERLEEDRGWFLEAGYFEGGKARALRAEVNALCREVAPCAVQLVDGFGIPDDVLGAPDGLAATHPAE
ncbi:MAG: acyl-CoA dehydrogenase [Gemmatimonadota bacterium]